MSQKVRTRYAPSPTGFQHIGGIRTALYCYLFTRKNGGSFVLRIEDTDRSRYVEGAEQYIIDSLEWLGIECDEGVHVGGDYEPYRQSERKEHYKKYVDQLVASGHAYYAFDTPEELNALRQEYEQQKDVFKYGVANRMQLNNSLTLSEDEVQQKLEAGENYSIRIKIPENEEVTFQDIVRGEITFNTSELDDKVIFKADGMPTYHLANVVDDHLMEITHVVRGEEWISSTPLHVLLYRFLGWESSMPQFSHLPLILKPDGKGKLSKRAADKLGFPVFPLAWETADESSSGYKEIGFLPEAFVNVLAFMGWNPGTEEEIFSKEGLIDAFSLDRVSKAGAKFNFDKAKWFNEQYIKELPNEKLAEMLVPFKPEGIQVEASFLTKVCDMAKERLSLLTEFWSEFAYFFAPPSEYDEATIKKKWNAEIAAKFEQLRDGLNGLSDFNSSLIETTIKDFIAAENLKFGDVLLPFRLMLSGKKGGPSVFDMAEVMGQEETISRMNMAATKFAEISA